jgi:hypothetical protein
VSLELEGDKEVELAQMSVHIHYKFSSLLEKSEWISDYLVSDLGQPKALSIDSLTILDEQNSDVRDIFNGTIQEGDTILVIAHFIRSSEMKLKCTLEFDKDEEE